MSVSCREIVDTLGFKSENSDEWKACIGPFKTDLLGPRGEIQKGFKYFDDAGNKGPWEQCIQDMYTAYPEIWDEKKFRTPKYRYKVAHCFLVAQTKKMRAKTPAKRAAPAAKKRPREEGSDFSEEPPAKVQKVFPDLEFPEFICVLRFSNIRRRKSINYQEVRDF